MKECPNCKARYNDYDQYCLKCNYKLQFIKDSKIIDYSPNSNLIDKPQTQQSTNIPKCPTCGSTKVHPISSGKKALGFLTVGIFSSSFGKSFECDNCKYKW